MRKNHPTSIKEKISEILKGVLGDDAPVDLSVPDDEKFGHYATNAALRLAKARGVNPVELARTLARDLEEKAPSGFFDRVEAAPPGFVNMWLSERTLREELAAAARNKKFGESSIGKKKRVIVEYSAVNIAKLMHLGHLRTTIIGDAVANILEALGYTVVRWNYLGDWGTQFGKLIAAYKMWGKRSEIERNPVEELQKLYVRFHEEAKANPDLEKRGQEEFKKLEDGDEENRNLWRWFKKESLEEFEKLYKLLGVDFDVWIGESFFEEQMRPAVQDLLKRQIAERSEGSVIVRLDQFNLPPALIEKSDGASLYLTRDIANLEYRIHKYKPTKILYVVANEQALHFEQLFAIAKLLGLDKIELMHLKYGLVLGESGRKLSTRGGSSVSAKEALEKAVTLARAVVDEKNPDLKEKEKKEVARAVGLGALKYNDLKENRMTDITFDWEKMLDFKGESGPYLQYTYARLRSILRKAKKIGKHDFKNITEPSEMALARKILEFPEVVQRAGELYSTSTLAVYLYKLAVAANKFYELTPILKDEDAARRAARLALVDVASHTLRSGLALLGIEAPEKI